MTDPLSWPSVTPRYALPLLFSGQAQKEAFVNGAHALADALLHAAAEGETAVPPIGPEEGECWLVAADAEGVFAGRGGQLACRQGGIWLFAEPRDGMRLFDRASGQFLLYAGGWRRSPSPQPPAGGTTVDAEARVALESVVIALQKMGIFPAE